MLFRDNTTKYYTRCVENRTCEYIISQSYQNRTFTVLFVFFRIVDMVVEICYGVHCRLPEAICYGHKLKSLGPIDRKFHGHGENDRFVLYE